MIFVCLAPSMTQKKLKDALREKGINPDRLALEWVSASEGQRFAEVVRNMEALEVDEADIAMGKMIFGQPIKKSKERVEIGDTV